MPLAPTDSAHVPNTVFTVPREQEMATTLYSQLKTHVQDISPSSSSMSCSSPRWNRITDSVARFVQAIWPLPSSGAEKEALTSILASGDQLMRSMTTLQISQTREVALTPPPFTVTHKKYAWGTGLLMFGSLAKGGDIQAGMSQNALPATEPYTEPWTEKTTGVDESLQLAYTSLVRVPRALNFPHHVQHNLNTAFDWAELSAEKKEPVFSAVLDEYNNMGSSKRSKIPSESERLIALDLILLKLGAQSGVYQRDFQLLGEGIRTLLNDYKYYSVAKYYMLEAPSHIPIRVVLDNSEGILDEYFDITQQYDIQDYHFFSANSNTLDELILSVCNKQFERFVTDYGIPSMNEKHNVRFVKKYIILFFRSYQSCNFTTKELFLGMHKRYAVQETMVDIDFPRETHKFITSVLYNKPDITDYIERELLVLYQSLKQSKGFETLFKQSLVYRVKGIILNYLDVFKNVDVSQIVNLFLKEQALPQIATLQGKVIPNLLVFTDPISLHFVIVSLAYSELKVFKKNIFHDELGAFVFKHLTIFDQQRVTSGTLNINIMCDSGAARNAIYRTYCVDPHLGHAYSIDYRRMLYETMLQSIKTNINVVTYTNAEYRRDDVLTTIQNIIFKIDCAIGIASLIVTNPLLSALLASLGIGAGIGSVIINKKIMESSDNGVIFENALTEAKIGAWFTTFGAALDIGSSSKLIMNGFKAYKSKRLLGLGKTSLTSPHVSEELKIMIKPKMYDRQIQEDMLSAPDIRGLQWSSHNISYLKVNDKYVKVIKGDNNEIYYVGRNEIATKFTRDGEFKPLRDVGKKSLKRGLGNSKRRRYFYKNSPGFRRINISKSIFSGDVGYRTLANNHYVQFYTRNTDNAQEGGKVLIISAHGGYFRTDVGAPPVILPPETTVKFLSPHGTALEDPGLDNLVNAQSNIEGYLTIYNNQYKVRFVPQYQREWLFTHHYNPIHRLNVLGRYDGLQNYRHAHFADESPKLIANVLARNRQLSAMGQATLTDVLIVNSMISKLTDTSLLKASVQRVIDLDKSGELVNELGERYNTLVFAHCRSNLHRPENQVSLYRTYFPSLQSLSPGAFQAKVILTVYHRDSPQSPFSRQQKEMGEITFVPFSNDNVAL